MRDASQLVEHCFRHEYGRLVALLTRAYGVQHLDLVEDVVQGALSKALLTWRQHGVPDDPPAWLYRTARNAAIDALRRAKTEQRLLHENFNAEEQAHSESILDAHTEIPDPSLRLLFLCCHSSIAVESSVAFALKMVSGFSTEEIAVALLISKANAEKRITRAKESLRDAGVELADLDSRQMLKRLSAVQSAVYLLFSEGYSSTSGNHILRRDLCEEAIRLTRMLTRSTSLPVASSAALLALMLLHSARFEARLDTHGAIILLDAQDRTRWDWTKIKEAMRWMAASTETTEVSRYHIESAIAWEHCRASTFESIDWNRVVELYRSLEELCSSPMIQLNRAIATSYAVGPSAAMQQLIAMDDKDRDRVRPWWDCALADVHLRLGNRAEALAHYLDAVALSTNEGHRAMIQHKIRNLEATRHD